MLSTPGLLGRSWVASIYLPLRGRINSWRRGSSAAWEAPVELLSEWGLEGGSWRGAGRQDGGVQCGRYLFSHRALGHSRVLANS